MQLGSVPWMLIIRPNGAFATVFCGLPAESCEGCSRKRRGNNGIIQETIGESWLHSADVAWGGTCGRHPVLAQECETCVVCLEPRISSLDWVGGRVSQNDGSLLSIYWYLDCIPHAGRCTPSSTTQGRAR
ncbi:hypothetical protein J3F83DRAFT_747955 [Trichoderma novae-zelandiae]